MYTQTYASLGRLLEERRNIDTSLQSKEEKECPIPWISKPLCYMEENIIIKKKAKPVHLYKMQSPPWLLLSLHLPHQTNTHTIHRCALWDSAVETKHCFEEIIPAVLPVAGEAHYWVWLAPFPATSVWRHSHFHCVFLLRTSRIPRLSRAHLRDKASRNVKRTGKLFWRSQKNLWQTDF